MTKRSKSAAIPPPPDTTPTRPADTEFLSSGAKDLRHRAEACRVAGGKIACRRLDAAAELLDPGSPATQEPTTPAKPTKAKPARGKAQRAAQEAARVKVAELPDEDGDDDGHEDGLDDADLDEDDDG